MMSELNQLPAYKVLLSQLECGEGCEDDRNYKVWNVKVESNNYLPVTNCWIQGTVVEIDELTIKVKIEASKLFCYHDIKK